MLQKVRILKRFTLAIVTLLSIAFSAATAQTSAGTSIVGTWQGALDVGGTKLRIVFHVAKTDGGNFVSTLDSPDQAATRIPVSSTTVREDSVILTVASIGGLYIGRISGDKSSIEGRWNQGGASFSLALNRASTAAVTVQTSATNATAQTSVDTSIVGMWQGTLDAGGVKLRAVFHVAKTDSDKFVSTFDSPDQGANGIPVSSTTVNGDSVIFTLASIGGSYVGKISDDKSSIEGKWSQNGASLDLSLNRTSTAVKFNRPQEPNPPFPYKSEEVSFENETTGMHYAGTLTLPDSGGRFPAVILITGSGTHNRNEEVFGHKPFLVIADYLTRRGIAVLRIDDRGIGGSTGKKSAVTSADHAKDVIAEIEFLKSRRDIDPKRIGLVGHSEGGIIAPLVASQSKDVAFIVLMGGPGVPGYKIILSQLALIDKAAGESDTAINAALSMEKRLLDIVITEKDSVRAVGKLRYVLETENAATAAAAEASVGQLLSPWYRSFLSYDPNPVLRKVKCPVLALWGSKDLQVSPSENLPAVERALKSGGNKDFKVVEIPGLNHLFQDAKTGSPNEYVQIEETFSPAALKVMGDWILENTGQK